MAENEENITPADETEETESETDLDDSYEPDDLPDSFHKPAANPDESQQSQRSQRSHRSQRSQRDDAEKAKKKEPEPNPLTSEDLHGNSICMLEPISGGLSCAYVRMDVPNRKLTDISMLENYIHLRYIDLSHNYLQDIKPISAMTHLVAVNASKNRLRTLNIEPMPYLQSANFANNKLTTLEGTAHPNLEKLTVASNRISRLRFPDPSCLGNLRVLDLRGNKLETLDGVYPPNLEELYVASNLLNTIGRMEGVENLKRLHLRDNQIENLDGIDQSNFKSLTYLNVRGNSLDDPKEFKKLRSIGTIAEIIVEGNPITESDDHMDVVLGAMGAGVKIKRFNKHTVTREDLVFATQSMLQLDAEPEEAAGNDLDLGDTPETADKSTDAEISFNLSVNISEP